MDILSLVRLAAEQGASDVHIVAFSPPLFRTKGAMQPELPNNSATPSPSGRGPG